MRIAKYSAALLACLLIVLTVLSGCSITPQPPTTVPEEPTTYPTVPVPVTTTTANGPGKTNRNSLLDGITLR